MTDDVTVRVAFPLEEADTLLGTIVHCLDFASASERPPVDEARLRSAGERLQAARDAVQDLAFSQEETPQ